MFSSSLYMEVGDMWYSPQRLLSYNKIFNFCLSPRGPGKTFSFKEWAIRDFLNNKKKFIYLRRHETELTKNVLEKFWKAIIKADKFPNVEFGVQGRRFYINGEVAGEAIALSTSLKLKSDEYADYNKIGYDEFIVDKGYVHYIPEEVELFLEFYKTVDRLRDETRVIFMANIVSVTNPYFTYFDIKPNKDKRFNVFGQIVVEFYVGTDEFKEKTQKTRFGQLVENTRYGDYMKGEKYLRDNDDFVGRKPPDANLLFSIAYLGKEYGFWKEKNSKEWYASRKYSEDFKLRYCLRKEDVTKERHMIEKYDPHMVALKEKLKKCLLVYEDMEVKNQILEMLK